MVETHDDASSLYKLHIATIGAAAGVYLWNIFDIVLTNPQGDQDTSNSRVDFKPYTGKGFSGIRANIRF